MYVVPVHSSWKLCGRTRDRKSTRLNSSHGYISYAVFCLKKKIDSVLGVLSLHEGNRYYGVYHGLIFIPLVQVAILANRLSPGHLLRPIDGLAAPHALNTTVVWQQRHVYTADDLTRYVKGGLRRSLKD